MASDWIQFVKAYQNKTGCSYKVALQQCSKIYKKGNKKGEGFLDFVRDIGHNAGKSFPVNPFDLGYQLGHDVIAPELKKSMR